MPEKGMRHISKVVKAITDSISKVQVSEPFADSQERISCAKIDGKSDGDLFKKVENNVSPAS